MLINWPSRSGRLYAFDLQPINTNFEELPGIYILCKPSPEGRWDALAGFVTHSFNESLTSHVTDLIARYDGLTHVAVAPFDDLALAEDALRDMGFLEGG